MTNKFRLFVFGYCLLIDLSAVASKRMCYRCLVRDGCLWLDVNGKNVTEKCATGVEHCVSSQTKSKVTGAVATDYMCGGRVYDVEKPSIKDGCFEGADNPGSRTKRKVCYCSSNLCNEASKPINYVLFPVLNSIIVFLLFS